VGVIVGRSVSIRPLTLGDVPAAAALEAANQPVPWSEGVFREELAAEDRIYLAADSGALVGFGGIMMVGEDAHVTNLLVDPRSRRKGLGLALMTALIRAAVASGARHLTLEVRSSNRAARALYTKLGLAPVGVRKAYYGDEDALILWAHDIDGDEYRARLERLA
jgi:ribosomal-protein-alanine N-acetyltransferase